MGNQVDGPEEAFDYQRLKTAFGYYSKLSSKNSKKTEKSQDFLTEELKKITFSVEKRDVETVLGIYEGKYSQPKKIKFAKIEYFQHIFSFLPLRNLFKVMCSSRMFHACVNTNAFWYFYYGSCFGKSFSLGNGEGTLCILSDFSKFQALSLQRKGTKTTSFVPSKSIPKSSKPSTLSPQKKNIPKKSVFEGKEIGKKNWKIQFFVEFFEKENVQYNRKMVYDEGRLTLPLSSHQIFDIDLPAATIKTMKTICDDAGLGYARLRIPGFSHPLFSKIINALFVDDWNLFFENLDKYSRIYKELDHPNITRCVGIYIDYPRIGFISLCHFRTLQDLIEKSPEISLKKKISIILQIARGLEYLHSKGIHHRFLTSRNILISSDNLIKIGNYFMNDYFYSQIKSRGTSKFLSYYTAPEVSVIEVDENVPPPPDDDYFFDDDDYFQQQEQQRTKAQTLNNQNNQKKEPKDVVNPEKADTFSFGVILSEIVLWKLDPFGMKGKSDVPFTLAQDKIVRVKVPPHILNDIKYKWLLSLMKFCLSLKWEQRFTSSEIVDAIEENMK